MTHVPTDEYRRIITVARGCKMRMSDIEKMLGISTETINKYYKHELEAGKANCDIAVATAMMEQIRKGDASLIKYYMNNQMGFSEKPQVSIDINHRTEVVKQVLDSLTIDATPKYIEEEENMVAISSSVEAVNND